MSNILITGTAGFIGFHLANKLMAAGHTITGIDNINDYYDPQLKYDRLQASGFQINPDNRTPKESGSEAEAPGGPLQGITSTKGNYSFYQIDLADKEALMQLFAAGKFDFVVNLAAQAGVRYSLTNPQAYVDANITGFLNILEACRAHPVKHLVYASSSSVYGKNTEMPFSVNHNVDHPVSLYAASKKSNELMAHTYSHLFGIPATGLRFFTVYGPWGRPDMALFLFTKAMIAGEPIQVFNEGNMMRDFTYVDDIVEGIIRVMERPATANPAWDSRKPDPATSNIRHCVYNIGRGQPVKLMDFIAALETALDITADKYLMPMQAGDVPATWADTKALEQDTGYKPATPVEEGIKRFVKWYKSYYFRPNC
jgi:UDP-glucuronate 4-epimerase